MLFRIPLASLALLVSLETSASAAVQVNVRYVIVSTEISPQQRIDRSDGGWGTSFILEEGGKVIKQERNMTSSGSLRDQLIVSNNTAGHYPVTYRVHNNSITETSRFKGDIIEITIRTDGVSSCHADIRIKKLPGHPYPFTQSIEDGSIITYSERHAENVTCAISKAP